MYILNIMFLKKVYVQNKGNIRLDVRTLSPVTLHRRVLVWFPAPPLVPVCLGVGVSLVVHMNLIWHACSLFTRTEQAETNFSSSSPESHLCSHNVWGGRNPKEETGAARDNASVGMGFKNGIFKNENNDNESIEDKVVHMNPFTAATTQLNQNISTIGQLTHDQNISRWWKYDPNRSLTCRWSSKAPICKRIQHKWVKASDGDVYMSLLGQNTM